ATTTSLSPSRVNTTGFVRSRPDFAPFVVRRSTSRPRNGPLVTLPCARKSAMRSSFHPAISPTTPTDRRPFLADELACDEVAHEPEQEERSPPTVVHERVRDEPAGPDALRVVRRARRGARRAKDAQRRQQLRQREEDDEQQRRKEADRDEVRDGHVLRDEHDGHDRARGSRAATR